MGIFYPLNSLRKLWWIKSGTCDFILWIYFVARPLNHLNFTYPFRKARKKCCIMGCSIAFFPQLTSMQRIYLISLKQASVNTHSTPRSLAQKSGRHIALDASKVRPIVSFILYNICSNTPSPVLPLSYI